MPPPTTYNADSAFQSFKVKNMILGFSETETTMVRAAFQSGHVNGLLMIEAIKKRKHLNLEGKVIKI